MVSRDVITTILVVLAAASISCIQGAEVCYEDLGCFSNVESCHRAPTATFPPDYPLVVATRFLLYTRKVRLVPHPISRHISVNYLEKTSMNSSRSTKIIVHGYCPGKDGNRKQDLDRYTGMFNWMIEMKDALLDQGDFNVILVDWTGGSSNPMYFKSVQNTRVAGREIGVLLKALRHKVALDYADVHIIGMSLGAHVAGYAGKYLNGKVARITGLDPAGPSYQGTNPLCRLDEADAIYVDVIHTDIDVLGINHNVGDVDFYPNGGHNQPGCLKDSRNCSHKMSATYFTLSTNGHCPFTSFPCVTTAGAVLGGCDPDVGCPTMGCYSDLQYAHGQLCVVVHEERPFCDKLFEKNPTAKRGEKMKEKTRPHIDSDENIGGELDHNVFTEEEDEGSGSIDDFTGIFFRNTKDKKRNKKFRNKKLKIRLLPQQGRFSKNSRN